MAACDYCGSAILFSERALGSLRFCDNRCARNGRAMAEVTSNIPHEEIEKKVREIHQGDCPKCGGRGPVDVHTWHIVVSLVFVTKWSNNPTLCCRWCGLTRQLGGLLGSLVLGWWGFPFGFFLTPIQIARNVGHIVLGPDPHTPSPALASHRGRCTS
jgi:hypothetical protein